MSGEGLRDALEKLVAKWQYSDGKGLRGFYEDVESLLATGPAEPAGVSDEAAARVHEFLQKWDNGSVIAWAGGRGLRYADVASLLAARPAQPAGVSDEAVEAARRLRDYLRHSPSWEDLASRFDEKDQQVHTVRASDLRHVLDALETARLSMGATPVASRERVAEVLWDFPHPAIKTRESCLQEADALLAAGVFREPPTREQIDSLLETHGVFETTFISTERVESSRRTLADAVLNLLGGAE